jgi:uncharacterized protein
MSHNVNRQSVSPSVRVLILLVSLVVAGVIAYATTGSVLPQDPQNSLIFQNSLLLIVLGSSLLERHYTKPADSLVNSLAGAVTLVGVKNVAPALAWWAMLTYCLLVFTLSTACVYASIDPDISGWRKRLASITYGWAVALGASRILFSTLFLFGLFSFYSIHSVEAVIYVLFWGLFIVIWPLRLPEWLSGLRRREDGFRRVGRIVRTDWPALVRVRIEPGTKWDCSSPKVVVQPGGSQQVLAPLYVSPHGDELIGTGLCLNDTKDRLRGVEVSCVYEAPTEMTLSESDIAKALGGTDSSQLIGFVVEESQIAQLRFETWSDSACQGKLVWCPIGNVKVHYQITNGITHEESFQADRQGRQIAEATQLGILKEGHGFEKHKWLPRMNTPVFADEGLGPETTIMQPGDFRYGTIPGTNLHVGGPFVETMTFHTAILGVTGAGKTELALDMLRHAVQQGVKVICIDLTARYRGRLTDLDPVDLSVSPEDCSTLNTKIFATETGVTYADTAAAKKALRSHLDQMRESVQKSLSTFLEGEAKAGIITLYEIANTDVTLRLTELYLTCLLNYARDHPQKFPKTLIVVEEAHTVMPEPSMAGVGSYELKGLVSKIAQIALQGRKYSIGLLVIAQRTATVSKSVLTQCNTIISFGCFDNTSLEFLSNFYGAEYASLLPNLGYLQAVTYGKGIRSERPVMIQIPFDEAKSETPDTASQVTDEGISPSIFDEEEIPF